MLGWESALIACLAGALGGVVNAFMSGNGDIILPQALAANGGSIWRPGIVGNILVGAIAALISWGLYGPAAGVSVISSVNADITWAGFAAAALVGVGGSRWLTAEVDKTLLKGAAVAAASKDKDPNLASRMTALSPAEAYKAATAH